VLRQQATTGTSFGNVRGTRVKQIVEARMRQFNAWLALPRSVAIGAVTLNWVAALIAIWGLLPSYFNLGLAFGARLVASVLHFVWR